MDPLGTNPSHVPALFVFDPNGTNLLQLRLNVRLAPQGGSEIYHHGVGFDISTDGSKVVYLTGSGEAAGINADGTANHTFSSTTNAADVVIAGNGERVAYAVGFPGSRAIRTRTFDGNPATIVILGTGEVPKITDDAKS